MTATGPYAHAERVLRLCIKYIDIDRDFELRNRDVAFAKAGGVINYVFDATVFEIFTEPWTGRGQFSSAFSADWLDLTGADHDQRKAAEAKATEYAVMTIENVMAGRLPGQQDGRMLLTKVHYEELLRRCRAQLEQRSGSLTDEAFEKLTGRFARLHALMEEPAGADAELKRGNGAFRAMLSDIAADRDLEPVHQLRRLFAPKIRQRLAIVDHEYAELKDWADNLREDAGRWFKLLKEECALHGIRVEKGAPTGRDKRVRHSAALWDDAQSIAIGRALSRFRSTARKKFLFLTADWLVFNTYRRWFSELNVDEIEYREPFLMRRVRQYSPIFDLDSNETAAVAADLRDSLKQILRVANLPLNLLTLKWKQKNPQKPRYRGLLILKQHERAPIANDPDYADMLKALTGGHESATFNQMMLFVDSWRRLEQSAIEERPDLLADRLQYYKEISVGDPTSDESLVRATAKYVMNLRHEVLNNLLRAWLPIAIRIIEDWRTLIPENYPVRAPIGVRFGDNLQISVADVIEGAVKGGSKQRLDLAFDSDDLRRKEYQAFVVASCIALAGCDWSVAHSFAEMAYRMKGFRHAPIADLSGDGEGAAMELRYLNALTQRFVIGSFGPPFVVDQYASLRAAYDAAQEHLTECIRFHERPAVGDSHSLRVLRGYSERAALNLFIATTFSDAIRSAAIAMMTREDAEFIARHPDYLPDAAKHEIERFGWIALDRAEADLAECLALRNRLEGAVAGEQRLKMFKRIKRQFFHNIASLFVIRKLMSHSKSDRRPVLDNSPGRVRFEDLAESDFMLDDVDSNLDCPVWYLEVLFFRAWFHPPRYASSLRKALAREIRIDERLQIDRLLSEAILSNHAALLPDPGQSSSTP